MAATQSLLLLFATVFALNVIPAFAPPTWMVMSWIGFSRPDAEPVLLATVAACAATSGRLVLARLACALVRNRWMREADRQNIDVIKAWLEQRKGVTASLMLAYAFSPFPSNYIFIAYGLTGMRGWLIGLPFFAGRLLSYLAWMVLAQLSFHYFAEDWPLDGAYLGAYFVLSQVVLLGAVFLFTKVDWQRTLEERRIFLRQSKRASSI